jgi:hypothetical protein
LNQVAIQVPPNASSLVPTGLLTVDPGTSVGFDICTDLPYDVAFNKRGFASLAVGGVGGFCRVNVLIGQAIFSGPFDEVMIDIAHPKSSRRLYRLCACLRS